MSFDEIKIKIIYILSIKNLKFLIDKKIEDFDHKEDILFVHMNAKRPEIKLQLYLKPKMEDKSMKDVKIFLIDLEK